MQRLPFDIPLHMVMSGATDIKGSHAPPGNPFHIHVELLRFSRLTIMRIFRIFWHSYLLLSTQVKYRR